MILNSALCQNWIGCTVRTPKTQAPARTVPRLRAHCAQVACALRPSRALRCRVATGWAPYRSLLGALSCRVSARTRALLRRVTDHTQPPYRDMIFVSLYKTHVARALVGQCSARYAPLRTCLAARLAMRA